MEVQNCTSVFWNKTSTSRAGREGFGAPAAGLAGRALRLRPRAISLATVLTYGAPRSSAPSPRRHSPPRRHARRQIRHPPTPDRRTPAAVSSRERCWTADRLARRHLPHPPACPFCDQAPETINHILLGCVFARQVWLSILDHWDKLTWLPGNDGVHGKYSSKCQVNYSDGT